MFAAFVDATVALGLAWSLLGPDEGVARAATYVTVLWLLRYLRRECRTRVEHASVTEDA
jgi:hypothetical protein